MAFIYDPVKDARNVALRGLSFALVEKRDWDNATATDRKGGSMNDTSKIDPTACDDDNPEVTAAEMRRARPAAEVFGRERLAGVLGRPPKDNPKVSTTIRLSPDVLAAFKAEGRGWQTRIDETLRAHMPGRT